MTLVTVASKCNKPLETKYALSIRNNSDHGILYYVANVNMEHVYPDTALLTNRPAMQVIPPGKYGVWSISYPFEEFMPELPADTLSVYLFHQDSVNQIPWSQIRDNYKVLKRYDLSLQDLQNSNFTIQYP